ncbi:MAG: hypothetical protein B6U89_05670, partial [Desulfurococcales archaeon ex4484_58]
PERYVKNMDHYNRWIQNKKALVSAIVLTSGTVGSPKIFTYTIYDTYRNFLVTLRGIRYMYSDVNLSRTIFIVEYATAYPGATSVLVSSIAQMGKIIVIPTFLKETLDDIIEYLNKYFMDYDKMLLGYTTQLLYVTPRKFEKINPSNANFHSIVPGGEPLTKGARIKLREIYKPKYVGGMYGSTETRIQGMQNRIGEYLIYSDRTLIAVLRSDGSIGVDGEGELVITPLYVKGEIPGTILPMYRIGDRARVRYEDGIYIVENISRAGDELQIGAANFNPVVMSSLIEEELIKKGFREAEVLFVLHKDPVTELIRVIDVNVIGIDVNKQLVTNIVKRVLDRYSEILVSSKVGLIDLYINIYRSEDELFDKYSNFKPLSYHKGKKYIIVDQVEI